MDFYNKETDSEDKLTVDNVVSTGFDVLFIQLMCMLIARKMTKGSVNKDNFIKVLKENFGCKFTLDIPKHAISDVFAEFVNRNFGRYFSKIQIKP